MDMMLLVAELRAAELMEALRAAVSGAPHWRRDAARLLAEIEALVVPEPLSEGLRLAAMRQEIAAAYSTMPAIASEESDDG